MPYPSKTDRETILAAAMNEVDERGIGNLSLRGLAASLKLAPTALYRYFSDRAVLEAALAENASCQLHTAMQDSASDSPAASHTIRNIAFAYLKFARTHPHFYELVLRPCEAGSEPAPSQKALWGFIVKEVGTLSGPHIVQEASVTLLMLLHGFAQLEAAQVFGSEDPGSSLEFALKAWNAAATQNLQQS